MSPSSPCRCHSTSVLPSRSIESPRGSACYACPLTFRDGCPQPSVRTEPGRLLAFRFMSELLAVVLPRSAVSAALGTGPGDRWLACVGLHSVAGLAIVARAWHGGLPLEVHERFDVDAVAAAAAAGATLVSVVPTMLARLLDAGAGLERFRQVLLGGAPAPAGLVERAADLGASVVRTYGLTETFGGVAHDGHPLEGVELAIAGGGEITLRGPMLLRR